MQFDSKIKRNFWINCALGMIPDLLIAAIAAVYANGGVVAFVLVLVGLQILYFGIWLKNTIWAWILYKYKGRKQIRDFVLDYLKRNKYPEPDDYLKSPDEYFASVAGNESLSIDLRLKAASEAGSLNCLIADQQIQNFMRLSMAMEDAIEEYKRGFESQQRSIS